MDEIRLQRADAEAFDERDIDAAADLHGERIGAGRYAACSREYAVDRVYTAKQRFAEDLRRMLLRKAAGVLRRA